MSDTFYIVDGSAYIYRAFYAIRNLSNSKGFPTNAIYGFINLIRKLLEQENPEYIAITFDPFGAPERDFRTVMYPEYKANRDPMPDDLKVQLPYFMEFVEAMNIPMLKVVGVEADDLIATLTQKALKEDLDVCIVSADKDLMQLLGDSRVRMIDTMRDKVFTEKEVIERFGVVPDKVRYVMSLSGDSSDNVPGVPGIGEKIGGRLIAEFGDLETLLANVDKVSGKKRKENLVTFADQARLSLALVTLKDDVECEFDLEALRLTAPDLPHLTRMLTELEIARPLKAIEAWMRRQGHMEGVSTPVMPEPMRMAPKVNKDYRQVLTQEELTSVIEACETADRFAINLVTTDQDPLNAELIGISLSWAPNVACYIPCTHRYIGVPDQLALELVLEQLEPLFESETHVKVVQNYKYQWLVLRRFGVSLDSIEWDTMLMSYLIDPGKVSHRLDAISKDYLAHETLKFTDVVGKGKDKVSFEMVDLEKATQYAAELADVTLSAALHLEPVIIKAELRKIHDEIELPLSLVLGKMEQAGIHIDTEKLAVLSTEFKIEIAKLQEQINELAGRELNPGSPVQLREVLFGDLGLPVKKRTKTGASTDQSVLEELQEYHDLPALVLEYRSFTKLKGTYVDALPSLIRPETGRVHTDFNQAIAATGRVTSSNPNLQNIPVRTARGREIRRAFIPAEGKRLICADYSQIELRIMAHMSGDETLLRAYQEKRDIHMVTAAQIFDIPIEEVSADQRRAGKTVNFGVMYGMGPNRLARDLKIPRKEAKQYITNYFARYQGVEAFFDRLKTRAAEVGYCETLFGRRRILEHINGFGGQRAFSERVAVNMPIQGTAADIIKIAMLHIQDAIEEDSFREGANWDHKSPSAPMTMLLQVHDELIFEVDESRVLDATRLIKSKMEGVIELEAPLIVDVGVGSNWLDAK